MSNIVKDLIEPRIDEAVNRLRQHAFHSSLFRSLGSPCNLAVVREYLRKSVCTPEQLRQTWAGCIFAGARCDSNLLDAGLASTTYPPHVTVFTTSLSGKLSNAVREEYGSRRHRARPVTRTSYSVKEFLRLVQTVWKSKHGMPTVLLPWFLPDIEHWTLIAAIPSQQDSDKAGIVWWGDSLGGSRPARILSVIRIGMDMLITDIDSKHQRSWSINRTENLITSRLGFMRQNDSYSCGYFVVSAVWTFADQSGLRYQSDVHLDDYKAGDVSQITENVRKTCIFSYMVAVLKCSSQGKMQGASNVPSETEVRKMLASIVRGYQVPFPCLEEKPSQASVPQNAAFNHEEPWPWKRQDDVKDLYKWIKQLNEKGFFTGAKLESRIMKSTRKSYWKYNRSLTLRCVNYTRASRCRAAVTAWQKKCDDRWIIEYRNVHNHERLTSDAKSKRDKQFLKDIKSINQGHCTQE